MRTSRHPRRARHQNQRVKSDGIVVALMSATPPNSSAKASIEDQLRQPASDGKSDPGVALLLT